LHQESGLQYVPEDVIFLPSVPLQFRKHAGS